MIREALRRAHHHHSRPVFLALATMLAIFIAAPRLLADEPYARSRDYDLQHSKIVLHFDLDQEKILGEVTHSLSILRDGAAKIVFDSTRLTIHEPTVTKTPPTSASTPS